MHRWSHVKAFWNIIKWWRGHGITQLKLFISFCFISFHFCKCIRNRSHIRSRCPSNDSFCVTDQSLSPNRLNWADDLCSEMFYRFTDAWRTKIIPFHWDKKQLPTVWSAFSAVALHCVHEGELLNRLDSKASCQGYGEFTGLHCKTWD